MIGTSVHDIIRTTIASYLPEARVLLFGSRATGSWDSRSDYDLLIITPQTLTTAEKFYWSKKLDRAIINIIRVPVDILLNSEEEVRQKQVLPGHIIRTALKEGIVL